MKNRDSCLLAIFCGIIFMLKPCLSDNYEPHSDCTVVVSPPEPKIEKTQKNFLAGETFSLNCTVLYRSALVVALSWKYPENVPKDSITETNNAFKVKDKEYLYSHILVANATKQHAGKYVCISKNNICVTKESSVSFVKNYLVAPILDLYSRKKQVWGEDVTPPHVFRLQYLVKAYPPITYYFLKNNEHLNIEDKNTDKSGKDNIETKYEVERSFLDDVILIINNLTVADTDNYTIVAENGYLTNRTTIELLVEAEPVVEFGWEGEKRFLENTLVELKCSVTGYPLPNITWLFNNGKEQLSMRGTPPDGMKESLYRKAEILKTTVHASGNITCMGINSKGSDSKTETFLVYEIFGGFGIRNLDQTWFSEGDEVKTSCLASKYDFANVTWFSYDDKTFNVKYSETALSYVATLNIKNISLNQNGLKYTCRGIRKNNTVSDQTTSFSVGASQPLAIEEPASDLEEAYPYQPIQFTCLAKGVPPPKIQWYKDGELLRTNSTVEIVAVQLDYATINSTIVIEKMHEEYVGTYVCQASNRVEQKEQKFSLVLKKAVSQSYTTYLIAIAVIIFLLILLVLYLTWKIKREKRLRKELAEAGLLYFKEGATQSLNPDLGINEQAELLPYQERFEFPAEKLTLGIQLGAGAFGVVYKAEARGIINAEKSTTVAVKMVKKTAENMFIKALASELKIMVHLGKHVNIVNLLGACTKNIGKRELIVIVEYCKFGNLHSYLQKHRDVFVDQLTEDKEKNIGKVNRAFSCSSGSTGINSDYGSFNNTQDTDHTMLNSANTNRSGRKVSEGYMQPEWRSNYNYDYSDGRAPRTLCTRDLLYWAFQIARGMEYLASRKVLHGDLAARNVLLAEDSIVKICDFGLARSIYGNNEYVKKENNVLPWRWMAIESMTHSLFSTQSDVWSFGIVLWELFSLAKTPYPSISNANLLQWLSDGNRLEKPPKADDRLYNVMLRCWELKPTARPTFSQLQVILDSFLDDNVREHYMDLNTQYTAMNLTQEGQEDYLQMMTAPDYNNLVTPSPHYVNERNFFPVTPTKIDQDGYLQMSPATDNIFSPRAQSIKFDFDSRKLNTIESVASNCGSELTPMLTLNELPARSGSESDHDGNLSPYLDVFPTIEEEDKQTQEDTKQNNAKNFHNTAVTNPTYITFDNNVEKKPKDIINNYINVPNGLVN